ncbi:MAG: DUF2306 domain-containing protein [Caulobacter sp.]|nr:DUF2306 domain-containing protein [Caulobacter sp.]
MTVTLSTTRAAPGVKAGKVLGASATTWFVTAAIGQVLFALYVAMFYGGAALSGNFQKWNDVLVGGYVRGGTVGNLVLAIHLLLAFVITVGGPLQLVPALRARFLPFHRWNGRVYMVTAFVVSLAGIYAVWTRGTAGGLAMRAGISLNGLLIVIAAATAWRMVLARRIDAHRRWALRAFILVSGVWFFRVGLMFWILANQGPVGIGKDFDGPFVRFWAYGCYLVPLAVLELYLRAHSGGGKNGRLVMATGLFLLSAITAIGIAGAAMGLWLPRLT